MIHPSCATHGPFAKKVTASRAGRARRSAVAAGVRVRERESSCEDKSLQGHEGRPFLRVAVSAQIRKTPSDHSLRNLQFGENRKLWPY